MERFACIKKIYEKHLEFERMSDSLKEIEAFINGILKSEHPISIRIDVDAPKTEKYEDSAEKLERIMSRQSGLPHIFGIDMHFDQSDWESRTEPLDVTETVVLMTTLLNIRRTKLESLRKELEELQFNINP